MYDIKMKMVIIRIRWLLVAAPTLVLLGTACTGNAADPDNTANDAANGDTAPAETDWEPREPESHAAAQPRLVVADNDSGAVTLVDAHSGETTATVDAAGPTRLTVADNEGAQVLLSGEEAQLLDTGIRWEAHGDHVDPANEEPELVEGTLDISASTPATAGDHHAALLGADESGNNTAVLHELDETVPEEFAATATIDAANAEVAVPLGEDLLLGGENDVQVRSTDDTEVADTTSCASVSSAVALDAEAAILGCADGALVAETNGDTVDFEHLAAPDADTPVTGLVAADDPAGPALGSYGETAVAVVDPAEQSISEVELPAELAALTWDPYWEQGLALTADGQLHAIDPEEAEITTTAEVTETITQDEGHAVVAAGESHVYLLNPDTAELIEAEVSRDGFERTRNLALDFTPADLAVVGLEPLEEPEHETDDHDHDHEDEHEDEHDH